MALVRAGIRGWETGTAQIPGKPDFVFRSKRVAVFVDGCFWHGCPECGHIPKKNSSFWQLKIELTRSRDIKSSERLREMGYSVLRFWEHELRGQLSDCISTVETRITV
jgi:DNA mismatch endonuclease (patch repair protein)